MRTDQRPHALRVAGRYAKDSYRRLCAWWKGPTQEEKDAWLREHHPWVFPMVEQVIAELRARQGKGNGRE